MTPIGHATLLRRTERGVELDCGQGRICRISVLGDGLARVLFLRDGAARLDRTWSVPAYGAADVPWEGRDRLDESAWPVPELGTEERADGLILATPRLRLEVGTAPLRLRWCLPDGQVFAADRESRPTAFGARSPSVFHAMARHPADRYFGLGDKTGALDLHGRRLRMAMLDSLGFDPQRGDPLYKHWPFLMARDGATGTYYGLFYDNLARGAFDLGCEHDNYYGLYRSFEAVDGDLDYYLILGPAAADVTRGFVRLTGRMRMPPRWTLGFAQTTMGLADAPDAQARMEDFIARVAAERIPVSAFHFGSGYTSIGPRRYVFNWNRAKFPDPEGLMRRFHDAGMRVVANLKPCLLDDHPQYAEAGAFIRHADGSPVISQFWDGEGAHIDFTHPDGVRWWQDGLERAVLGAGMDVGWNDNNEYGLWDEDAEADGFGRPVPLETTRAVQALLMTRATLERQEACRPAERGFTVTRAGGPGIQRYAQTWSGDNTTSWDSLRWNLRTGLTMGLSGMFNIGHDVGGFAGPVPDAELLIRWTQACCLHPRFIMNSWKPDFVYNSPWLHPSATPAIRSAIRLRYRLMPYLYSLMHAAVRDDLPVLRPTFLQFPNDPATLPEGDEMMAGPFLLAAPVVRPGERSRRLYLPAGPPGWFDLSSGEALPAGATATLAAPLHRLPLAVPEGAILPVTRGADYARLHDEPSRRLCLFPGQGSGESRFVLVEDDGISRDGPRTDVTVALSWTPAEVTVTVRTEGGYTLPYDEIALRLPEAERRRVVLRSAVKLVRDA